jgi:CheY-like chemotaxis protein
MIRILIVEDMGPTLLSLRDAIFRLFRSNQQFSGMTPVFDYAMTEEEFYKWQDSLVDNKKDAAPDIVVFDIILPYRRLRESDFGSKPRPLPENPPPMNEAGFRCAKKLREHPYTAQTPFIFYTALPSDLTQKGLEDFPDAVYKNKEENYSNLIESIEEILTKRLRSRG